jgi:cell division protein FtsW
LAASTIDYKVYTRHKWFKWVLYVVTTLLLYSTIVFGVSEGGAKRWIKIGPINFQPSEVAKVGYILFYAIYMSELKESGKIKNFIHGCIIPLVLLVPMAVAVYYFQNHFSATFIIAAVTVIQMYIAGTKLGHLVICGIAGGAGLFGYLKIKDYKEAAEALAKGEEVTQSFRKSRIEVWKNPESDPKGTGWQILQSLYTIASGGLLGVGLGESKQKYLYLPEPHNDFIFAVLAEELGFVGCAFVILLFGIFIWRGIVIAMRSPDTCSSLIAIGVVAMIGLQAIINIAVVTNTIPVTGMPLPFFSYGGSAMIMDLVAVGLLLNVSKHCKQK